MVSPVKFLVVDDRADNVMSLEALLQRDGVEVLTARSAVEALELVLVHDIALAFLDVNMPEMDGFELAELMRGKERSRTIPIIFVTAAIQPERRIFEGYDAGAVDFLFKPIDPRILQHKANVFFELYRQRQQIEETLRVAETLMAAVGHDLRNPLTSMLMASTLIASKSQDPTIVSLAQRIKASGQRMGGIIDDLFEMAGSRLGTGLDLSVFPMDLATVAARVTGELDPTKEKIKFTIEGDLHGTWDPSRLGRTLSNLLSNALTHGSGGVELAIRGGDKDVVVVVHNKGAIPAEVLPNIFDPFRAGRERSRRGLGLGLFIVRQIVLAHVGTISVTSTAADGTTFTITLPRITPARDTPVTPAASTPSA